LDTSNLHPMAKGHIPSYLPGADGSDPLFVAIAVFTILLIIGIGGLYFRLHALPEQMAHHGNHTQFQVVGILALLALFTHNNIFWVAALLLAAFRMPDFLAPLESIADSLRMQRLTPAAPMTEHVHRQTPPSMDEQAQTQVRTDPMPERLDPTKVDIAPEPDPVPKAGSEPKPKPDGEA
jgi:hypothetical protein